RVTFGDLDDFVRLREALHGPDPITPEEALMNTTQHDDETTSTPVDDNALGYTEDRQPTLADHDKERIDVGEDVFDVIDGFGTNSQRVAWQAIARSLLATALYGYNRLLDIDEAEARGSIIDQATIDDIRYQTNRAADFAAF